MPLHIAVVLSLVFHLAAYTLGDWFGLRAPPPPPPRPLIEAMLILPEVAVPPEPVPEPATSPPAAVSPAPTIVRAPPAAPGAPSARTRAALAPRPPLPVPLFYPPAAVLSGLEGEVLVQVTLDAGGDVVAARLERGSGHAILDEAALVAARTLKSLPASGQAVLPVRFKLR